MGRKLLRQRLRLRLATRQLGHNLIGAVDCEHVAEQYHVKSACVNMPQRRQTKRAPCRYAPVVEIHAVSARVLHDPAAVLPVERQMLSADIGAVEPQVCLRSAADSDAVFSADIELFKLQLSGRGLANPRRKAFLAGEDTVNRLVFRQLRQLLCLMPGSQTDALTLHEPPESLQQLQLQHAALAPGLRGKIERIFPVVLRREKQLAIRIRQIQIENILLHTAPSFLPCSACFARMRLSVTGVIFRNDAMYLCGTISINPGYACRNHS